MKFELCSRFSPQGGQPDAIKMLTQGFNKYPMQTLLGITGSGKTFVIANLIQNVQKPTLVIAHNKTLAAQLYAELKELFPKNRVEYFISYYDYYQPESYLPTTDTYIEKDSSINAQIEKMRLKATSSLLSRSDVIIVASISCIYSLGNPSDITNLTLTLETKKNISRQNLIESLVLMQYTRSDLSLEPAKFRVRGATIDIIPAYEENIIRVELFGDTIEKISELNSITAETIATIDSIKIFPAKQFVVPQEKHEQAIKEIKEELKTRLPQLAPLEAARLKKRINYDLEMIKEVGYCTGIENYSRNFDGRNPGEPPFALLNYFPKDFLLVLDESHQTIPQSRGMYHGDYARKKNLVDFGFRLPSAFDNRPLKFEEFEKYFNHAVFVSATPAEYELKNSGQIVELIIRPTGLLDPLVEVRPIEGHIRDLIKEIKQTIAKKERVLITTFTKRSAEDLANFLAQENIKVRYLHSEVQSLDRIELIRQLRAGEFDVLVGINLLREGLDLPEVSLVAILDADKEGFLRNERSLIQTIGRAARNQNGRVIMYADIMTDSIKSAIQITNKRRQQQILFNAQNNITPKTIIKTVAPKTRDIKGTKHLSQKDIMQKIIELESAMRIAAEKLDFEQAIKLRDAISGMQE